MQLVLYCGYLGFVGSKVEAILGPVQYALLLAAVTLISGLILSFGALVLYITTQRESVLYVSWRVGPW